MRFSYKICPNDLNVPLFISIGFAARPRPESDGREVNERTVEIPLSYVTHTHKTSVSLSLSRSGHASIRVLFFHLFWIRPGTSSPKDKNEKKPVYIVYKMYRPVRQCVYFTPFRVYKNTWYDLSAAAWL